MPKNEQEESLNNKCTHPAEEVIIWGEMQRLATCKVCGEDFYANEVFDRLGIPLEEE